MCIFLNHHHGWCGAQPYGGCNTQPRYGGGWCGTYNTQPRYGGNCCEQHTCYTPTPRVVVQVPGPQGPAGPAGPQGPMGMGIAAYATSGAITVAGSTVIPLAIATTTPTTTITGMNNGVYLPAGTYLVGYGATALTADATTTAEVPLAVSLQAGGATLTGETVRDTVSATAYGNVAKTIVYNSTGTYLTLANDSAEAMEFDNAYITAVRLA